MDIVKTDYYNNLYAVYKDLLTDKQRDVFELYFVDNLSLAEIAEDQHITRQAVKCCLDSGIQALDHYENALKFCDKVQKIEQIVKSRPSDALTKISQILDIAEQKSPIG